MKTKLSFVVTKEDLESGSLSLEHYLLDHCGIRPRSLLKKAFSEHNIQINHRRAKRTHLLAVGDQIEILDSKLKPKSEHQILPNNFVELETIGETKNYIAVNKIAGLNSHPLLADESQTILNQIVYEHPECALIEVRSELKAPLEGGLVHRLDQGTSGILVAARNIETLKNTRALFSNHQIEKVYCAWISGSIAFPVEIKARIAKSTHSKKKMTVQVRESNEKSWPTTTRVLPLFSKIIPNLGAVTFVLIQIITGVRHQIRTILSDLGHPILGDSLYQSIRPQLTDDDLEPISEENRMLFHSILAKHPSLQDRNRSPSVIDLPKDGIFLHSLYFRSDLNPELESGFYCTPPSYFGF